MSNNGFFEIVGDEEELAEDEFVLDAALVRSFTERASQEGYSDAIIEEAVNLMNSSTNSYEDFEKLIDAVIENEKHLQEREQAKENRIKASISLEVERLKGIKQPAKYLEEQIQSIYNTTAVSAMELVCECENNENLQLDVYVEPIYSLILQLKKSWVEDLINKCLAKWDNNPVVEQYIQRYLDYLGTPEEQCEQAKLDLIGFLPESIRNECSPDTYKEFIAVQLIMKDRNAGDSDATEEVFQNEEDIIDFATDFEYYVEEEVPYEAANAAATAKFFEKKSLASKAGSFVGKAVSLKYNMAKNFEDAMCESMGEYADIYKANRQKIKERKEQLKESKRSQMEMQKHRQTQPQPQPQPQPRQRVQQQQKYYQDKRYTRQNYTRQQNRDFAPQIPLPVMVGVGNLIVWLITALLFDSTTKLVCGVGLVIALAGFIRKKIGEPNATNMIAGGYAVAVLGILIGIM